MDAPRYGLVGRGRLAAHLDHYLRLEGRRVLSWHRGCSDPPESVLDATAVVLLAISDSALDGFVAGNPWLAGRRVVHFSGSRTVAGATGLHPLMTFGPQLYELELYRSIPFIAERGGAAFDEVFPGFANPSWTIDADDKPLYHALCVLSGNVTTLLWSKAMTDFPTRLGLPAEALIPFLRQTAANIMEHGGSSLTGPFARRDAPTIDIDLAGLDGDPYREVLLAVAGAHTSGGAEP